MKNFFRFIGGLLAALLIILIDIAKHLLMSVIACFFLVYALEVNFGLQYGTLEATLLFYGILAVAWVFRRNFT